MHRVFDAAQRERKREPVSFELRGESFACVEELSGWAVLDFYASENTTEGANRAVQQLFRDALVDADVPRFEALCRRKSAKGFRVVGEQELSGIAAWLLEAYSGRPPGPPVDSSGPSRNGGPTSKDEASSTVDASPSTG
jgi:hypothetical protein